MKLITIAYSPAISSQAVEVITDEVTPSMSSADGHSHQYAIDAVLAVTIPQNDRDYLVSLSSHCHFIEI